MTNQNICRIIHIQKKHMDKLIKEADNNKVDLMGLINMYSEAWDEFKIKHKDEPDNWNYGMEVRCSGYAFAKARRYIYNTKEFIDLQINGERTES